MTLAELKQSAIKSTIHRGHILGPWNDTTDHSAFATCAFCDAQVSVTTQPAPIDIGGSAVAGLPIHLMRGNCWWKASGLVIEMRICEIPHVLLKANQLYIFTVDPKCDSCAQAAARAEGERLLGHH